jgi:hypothetical protein
MTQADRDDVIRNLDARVGRIEQILPTLASKADLETAKSGLREEIQAMGAGLREEIREEGERTRRHVDVVAEASRDDIRRIAEGHITLAQQFERRLPPPPPVRR